MMRQEMVAEQELAARTEMLWARVRKHNRRERWRRITSWCAAGILLGLGGLQLIFLADSGRLVHLFVALFSMAVAVINIRLALDDLSIDKSSVPSFLRGDWEEKSR